MKRDKLLSLILLEVFLAGTHTGKELMHTGKRVKSRKSHMRRCIVYSDLEAKTEHENTGKVFFNGK